MVGSCEATTIDRKIIGYTTCADCRGTGKKSDETPCPNCGGTGWIEVFKEPPLPSKRPPQWSERRRFPRYYTDFRIAVRHHEEPEFAGRCTTIAEGGLGAVLLQTVPVGKAVTLGLHLSIHATAMTVQAVVRNQRGLRHGFEFVSLADPERVAIKQFCDEQIPETDDGRSDS